MGTRSLDLPAMQQIGKPILQFSGSLARLTKHLLESMTPHDTEKETLVDSPTDERNIEDHG